MSEKVGEHAHDAKHAKDEEKGGQNEPQVGDCGNPGGASNPAELCRVGWMAYTRSASQTSALGFHSPQLAAHDAKEEERGGGF